MPDLEERIQRLEDEAAIRNLAAAFADAGSRNDKTAFEALWKADGVWTIKDPLLNVCNGTQEIMALLAKLRDDKDFFVQFVHSGVVAVDGSRATARWLVREVGKGPGESYYNNYAFYSDAMEKVQGKWLFAERAYHYAYLDFSPFTGTAYSLLDPMPTR